MQSVVIYGSHFGNTQKVAEAIATELGTYGPVKLLAADAVPAELPSKFELLVVGGPIEKFRMTQPIVELLGRLESTDLHGVRYAAFETRIRPHWWLPGSAARGIAEALARFGAVQIAPPESFIVEGSINEAKGESPHLVTGELEHAGRWAAALAAVVVADSAPLVPA